MGLGLAKKMVLVANKMKSKRPADMDTYQYMKIVRDTIREYVTFGNDRICGGYKGDACNVPIGAKNRTGLCRKCYMRKARNNDQTRRLDALRHKYGRKNKKLRILNGNTN